MENTMPIPTSLAISRILAAIMLNIDCRKSRA